MKDLCLLLNEIRPDWHIIERLSTTTNWEVFYVKGIVNDIRVNSVVKVIPIPQNEIEIENLLEEGLYFEEINGFYSEVVDEFINGINEVKDIPNIVEIEECFSKTEEEGGFYLIIRTEMLTSLAKLMEEKKIKERNVVDLGIAICNALKVMERRGIVHRDIKPENIFKDSYGDYLLGDLGIANKLAAKDLKPIEGVKNYLAPEVIETGEYNILSDMYSLGLIMYEIMNEYKIPSKTEAKTGESTLSKPVNASEELAEVLMCVCDPNPEKRYKDIEHFQKALKDVKNGEYILKGHTEPKEGEKPVIVQRREPNKKHIAKSEDIRRNVVEDVKQEVLIEKKVEERKDRRIEKKEEPVIVKSKKPINMEEIKIDDKKKKGNPKKGLTVFFIIIVVLGIIAAGGYFFFIKHNCKRDGHVLNEEWIIDLNATCNEDGRRHQSCIECGEVLNIEIIPAEGHQFIMTETITEPTCEEDGLSQYVCEKCQEVREVSLNKRGHYYIDYICVYCGNELEVNPLWSEDVVINDDEVFLYNNEVANGSTIYIPEYSSYGVNVRKIGDYGFSCAGETENGWYKNVTIVIPETVNEIGRYAFESSTAKKIIIPTSVTNIDEYAFFNYISGDIEYQGTYMQWEEIYKDYGWSEGFTGKIICIDNTIEP